MPLHHWFHAYQLETRLLTLRILQESCPKAEPESSSSGNISPLLEKTKALPSIQQWKKPLLVNQCSKAFALETKAKLMVGNGNISSLYQFTV